MKTVQLFKVFVVSCMLGILAMSCNLLNREDDTIGATNDATISVGVMLDNATRTIIITFDSAPNDPITVWPGDRVSRYVPQRRVTMDFVMYRYSGSIPSSAKNYKMQLYGTHFVNEFPVSKTVVYVNEVGEEVYTQ